MNKNLDGMGLIQSAFKHECQLIDPIRESHHDGISKLPPTSLIGSVSIYKIFESSQLRHIAIRGLISINESLGDHCALFIDIPLQTLLGESAYLIHRYRARRLVCNKPKVVSKFNKRLRHQLESPFTISLFDKFMKLHKNGLFNNPKEEIKHLFRIG